MSKNHFIRFLGLFAGTNRYQFVQAVPANNPITSPKMIFKESRGWGTSRLIDLWAFEMIFGKLVRFLRQFRDTNRHWFVQAVPANNPITSSKMIFKESRGWGTSRLIDPTTFEMIFRDSRYSTTSQLFNSWAFESKGN